MRERRRSPAADDGRRLVHERGSGERLDHGQREVDPARPVARKDGIADVAAPCLPGDEFAHLTEMAEYALGPGYAYAKEFAVGLELILDSVEQRLRSRLVAEDNAG